MTPVRPPKKGIPLIKANLAIDLVATCSSSVCSKAKSSESDDATAADAPTLFDQPDTDNGKDEEGKYGAGDTLEFDL